MKHKLKRIKTNPVYNRKEYHYRGVRIMGNVGYWFTNMRDITKDMVVADRLLKEVQNKIDNILDNNINHEVSA
jgi:hypothetical protein